MRDFSIGHEWLSINTATVRQWTLPEVITGCQALGIRAISPWRDQVAACGLIETRQRLDDAGISLSGYCRGGMFTGSSRVSMQAIVDDNRRAIDEAVALGARCLVLVVGGLPGALDGAIESRDLAGARASVHAGIDAILTHARGAAMPLAIEPLHPMYAADRACINTLDQALDVCAALDPAETGALGVAVDCYHVWWDPGLERAIHRAGRARRILAFHVSDWLVPTRELLNDRGMMGDGVIEISKIRNWVEAAGFNGFSEVEIFSAQNWWTRPGDEVLRTCIERHVTVV